MNATHTTDITFGTNWDAVKIYLPSGDFNAGPGQDIILDSKDPDFICQQGTLFANRGLYLPTGDFNAGLGMSLHAGLGATRYC